LSDKPKYSKEPFRIKLIGENGGSEVPNGSITIEKLAEEVRNELLNASNSADWDYVQNKPKTYPPSDHTHSITQIPLLVDLLNKKVDQGYYNIFRDSTRNRLDVLEKIEPWNEPTFENGWGNFIEDVKTGYRKDSLGRVYFRGEVVGGSDASICFTLPEDYTPEQAVSFGTTFEDGTAQIYVGTDGAVTLERITEATDKVISLDGVFFFTD